MEAVASVAVVAVAALVGLRWWLAFRAREAERNRQHRLEDRPLAAEAVGNVAVEAVAKRVQQLEAWKDTQALRALR